MLPLSHDADYLSYIVAVTIKTYMLNFLVFKNNRIPVNIHAKFKILGNTPQQQTCSKDPP